MNCTVARIAKNLQFLPLAFSDAVVFKGQNAKNTLDIALAFSNANALRSSLFGIVAHHV